MSDAYYIFYHVMMAASIIGSIVIIVFMWQRRWAPGAKPMIGLAATTLIWAAGFLAETHGQTIEVHILIDYLAYAGLMGLPIAWFLFTLSYTASDKVITRKLVIILSIIPVLVLVLIWTNHLHGLMWYDLRLEETGPFTVLRKTYGIAFWIALAHNYLYIVSGAIMLIRHLFIGHSLYKGQAISLLVAALLPLLWNVIFVFHLLPLPRKDLTPVAFAISGLAIVFGLMRFQLFTTVPFARKFLIQQLSEGVIVVDNQDRVLEVNRVAMDIFTVGKNSIGHLIKDVPALASIFERLTKKNAGYIEYPVTVHDEAHVFEIKMVPMNNDRDEQIGKLVILYDVTERNKLQERLIARDRLASIGEFTAGVAHELNNPLAVIMGYSELISEQKVDKQLEEDLAVIAREAERAASIVEKLLTFARKHPDDKQSVDINMVIRQTIELRTYEQKENKITTEIDLDPGIPDIVGNETHLQQVFINIFINAEQFMFAAHGQGTVKVKTGVSEGMVQITIEDDGPGIPVEYMNKIFNPFFTTKDIGKGTGLGLSICYGIIKDHGGKIWAKNNAGSGVTFFIKLPVHPVTDIEADEGTENGQG